MIFCVAVILLFLTASSFGAEFEPPRPWSLAHWVRLTDGSLLVGQVESIDAERLLLDLRLDEKAIVSVPRRNIVSLTVIPPVDPALIDEPGPTDTNEPGPVSTNEPGPVVPVSGETMRLVDGEELQGRLRSFSKGVFRFDLAFGGSDELFLEAQPISWRRVRVVRFYGREQKISEENIIFLRNGTKIFCEYGENAKNNRVTIRNALFSTLELSESSVIFTSKDDAGR